ncbi:MAG: hypothetical protein U0V56_08070 [Actinomycetota bacterium]
MEQIPIGDPAPGDPGNVVELPTPPFSSPPEEEPNEDALGDAGEPPGSGRGRGRGRPPPPAAELDALLEHGVRVALGMVSVAATAVSSALERTMPGAVEGSPVAGATLAGASLGLGIESTRLASRSITALSNAIGPLLSFATAAPSLRERAAPVARGIDRFNEVWTEARPEHEAAAAAFVADLMPRLVDGIVEQLDLTALVAERIDLDAIVDRIDLDAIVDRIDVDEIVRRVDLDDAVGRVDLIGITDKLIGEVDLPELIRESTGAVTSETVRNVRMLSAEVDRRLAEIVDRVLLRRRERADELARDGSGDDVGVEHRTAAEGPASEDPAV